VLNEGEIRCESPPKIVNGFYHPPLDDSSSSSTSEELEWYSIGTELQAKCDSSFNLPCDSSYRECGRITCERDGTWSSRHGRQLITTCAAGPAEPVTSDKCKYIGNIIIVFPSIYVLTCIYYMSLLSSSQDYVIRTLLASQLSPGLSSSAHSLFAISSMLLKYSNYQYIPI